MSSMPGARALCCRHTTGHGLAAPVCAGYFCLAAGVSLASGVQIGGLASWAQLASADALVKLAPAAALVILITLVLHRVRQEARPRCSAPPWAGAACALGCGRCCLGLWQAWCPALRWPSLPPACMSLPAGTCRSPFALPALLVAVPAAFYGLLWTYGISLDEAREAGWVSKPNVSASFGAAYASLRCWWQRQRLGALRALGGRAGLVHLRA